MIVTREFALRAIRKELDPLFIYLGKEWVETDKDMQCAPCAQGKVHCKCPRFQVHESHEHIQGVMNTSYHLCGIIHLLLPCI